MCDDVRMSEYGRLWEEVSTIRRAIREAVPGANTDTLAQAEASVAALGKTNEVGVLLRRWARLEQKMALCD